MAAKIEIIDKKSVKKEQIKTYGALKESHKRDIQTYESMIQEIDGRLNNTGFKIERKRSGQEDTRTDTFCVGYHRAIKISPFSLGKNRTLKTILIKLYQETIFPIVEAVACEYHNKYNNLEKITISKEFKNG